MSSETTSSNNHPIYYNAESLQAVSDNGLNSAEAITNATEAITRAIDINDKLDPKEKKEIKEWMKNKKELRIIATGKTGAGKSSLLNCFVGAEMFQEGADLDPCTVVVDQKHRDLDGIRVVAWDCPGLQDGLDNEEEYLRDLAEKTERNVDLMLYCIDMSTTRATDLRVHGSAIKKLTEILGPGVWSNTVIALTFGNLYMARLQTTKPGINGEELVKEFQKQIDLWKTKLQEALSDVGVPDILVNALPFCPAGYYTTPHLPGYPLWASHMWMTMLLAVKEYAQPLPIMLNVRRLREKSELSDECFLLPPQDQPIFFSQPLPYYSLPTDYNIPNDSATQEGIKLGATIGAGALGSVGASTGVVAGVIAGVGVGVAAGTTAGGIVGGILVGALTFGAGTAAGVAIGAGLGLGIGLATGMLIDLHRRRKQKKDE